MNDKPKHSITDVIRFLEDRQLEQDWDIRRDAIQYLREYAEKKDDLDELIKKEALETYKAVRITSILADMLEEKRIAKVKWGASYGEIMNFRFEGICECGQEVDHLWDYCPSCGMKLE